MISQMKARNWFYVLGLVGLIIVILNCLCVAHHQSPMPIKTVNPIDALDIEIASKELL